MSVSPTVYVARMSVCDMRDAAGTGPAYRCAHAGYYGDEPYRLDIHFDNSFRPSRISCAVSAFSPALRDAAAIAAAACGWP